MDTPQKARRYYNRWSQYEQSLKSDGWQVPRLLAGSLLSILNGGENIADIGCGTGLVGKEMHHLGWTGSLVGVDIAEKRLKQAHRKSIYNFCIQADAHQLPFDNQIFNVVVSAGMVGITNISSIQEMRRIIRYGGYLACVVGDLKDEVWSRKRFKEAVAYFNQLPNAEMLSCEDLGSGYTDEYDDEHYVFYLFRCK